MMPRKMMTRYCFIRGFSSSGTRRTHRMPSNPRYTSRFSTSAMPAMSAKDWNTLCRIRSCSPLPYCIEMAAPLPMHRPSKMEVRKVIRV